MGSLGITNVHLQKIIIEYIDYKLLFINELRKKTEKIKYDVDIWRYYTKYSIRYQDIGNDFPFFTKDVPNYRIIYLKEPKESLKNSKYWGIWKFKF